ncbi:MAG: class I SAM-dependent methyltransferase [candidate division KSB1 bacterium]|nr:class I SAM-dependent methyltransferase [candidate division KSB1 bacterium]MDZ7275084.1 class I SAM-dependent methyltransferase [candidate division KSB1 bacterium]MDZ7286468.1 class I SAM-dependent methyltransferase [candidate division KSB1 bacterium]MDZ7299368.1 class I SAM-dependent methyltransferase [candidate division KSB1 bacterium]MDZ7306303.1 class I SAM-dependent methyltransferase [candidate division KSB1 bacterium]
MDCCTLAGTNKFFNLQAGFMLWRFKRHGLRPEQRLLVEGIRRSGLSHAGILEIGCGVGALHLTLLQNGAATAVGIDISEKMIATARRLAAEMALQPRTSYQQGDFLDLHDKLAAADVTILDKVICCYPDAQRLIAGAAARTRQTLAVSYPRHSHFARLAFRLVIAGLRLLRFGFHPYYHPPAQIEAWIHTQGFEKAFEAHTPIWAVQVYQRRA